ncbi:MAG: UDP-N-acetylglucosamine 2-epimerase (non-hydrolyzing) [Candidatus Cloacimonetes bacterium]|nr:UDP-N-acetylglucosamine 2-epimerase (non-hydrolyzing) [Candidatus Cloacimonadota bacterium]
MKIHLIVGARPNFMKIAPLYKELAKYSDIFQVKLIHTGQHYDERMSKFFFDELQLPVPDKYLEVGSASHGVQTARIMERYEEVLFEEKPDLVVVAGDVNSTMACALDAVKMHIPVAHLEAGLRSFDMSMPEEINRIVTDSISDYLLTPSPDGDENLIKEGITKEKIFRVGNIMIDSLIQYLDKSESSTIHTELNLQKGKYCLITLHRPSNVDHKENLATILGSFKEIAKETVLVFPMHPRTLKNIEKMGLKNVLESILQLRIVPPVGYYDFIHLQRYAKFIVTDSGGIQEESTFMNVPCLTLRDNTERPITVTQGSNILVKLNKSEIIQEVEKILQGNIKKAQIPDLWDGKTAERIVEIFMKMEKN